MKSIFFKIFLFLQIIIIFSSCSDDDSFSTTPHIEFIEISPVQVVSFSDVVTITISYKDEDGDLGENNPDRTNLFVTDSRNNVTYEYRISELSPTTGIAIQGNLNIELPSIAILDDNNSIETVHFDVYLRDRAGNTSNTIITSEITIITE